MGTFARHTAAPRVIVAEDDREMRRLLVATLRDDGYAVTEASSGQLLFEALQAAMHRREAPGLVVSDVRMPGGNGLQVLRATRVAGWKVPFILITAFGDDDVLREGSRLGAACVLSKPFDMDDLRAAAANIVSPPRSDANGTGLAR